MNILYTILIVVIVHTEGALWYRDQKWIYSDATTYFKSGMSDYADNWIMVEPPIVLACFASHVFNGHFWNCYKANCYLSKKTDRAMAYLNRIKLSACPAQDHSSTRIWKQLSIYVSLILTLNSKIEIHHSPATRALFIRSSAGPWDFW